MVQRPWPLIDIDGVLNPLGANREAEHPDNRPPTDSHVDRRRNEALVNAIGIVRLHTPSSTLQTTTSVRCQTPRRRYPQPPAVCCR